MYDAFRISAFHDSMDPIGDMFGQLVVFEGQVIIGCKDFALVERCGIEIKTIHSAGVLKQVCDEKMKFVVFLTLFFLCTYETLETEPTNLLH